MMLHRPDRYEPGQHEGVVEIIVAKQRNGPVGEVTLHWFQEFTRFKNAAQRAYSEFEQYAPGQKIIRPRLEYVGPQNQPWIPIEQR